MIPTILASGRHEIGVHGWIHEHLPSLNDAAAEQDMLTRAIETLTKAIGKKPVGYRAPSWHFSQHTMAQIKAAGFLYDSSLMASDDAYEILMDKKADRRRRAADRADRGRLPLLRRGRQRRPAERGRGARRCFSRSSTSPTRRTASTS